MKLLILILAVYQHSTVYCKSWSYLGETGPDNWSSLYPECSKTKQSPVDIFHEEAQPDEELSDFEFYGYDNTNNMENLTVWNDGYTVTVRVHGDLKISGGGLEGLYELAQFHFHWGHSDRVGSEHFLDGKSYPLEMHLVHKTVRHEKIANALSDPKGLAVLGVFAQVGKPHPYFQAIIDNLRLLDIGDYANVRPFPLMKLLPDDYETYYRYNGSLTTPPCSESVVWTVFREPIEISEFQLQQLRALSSISNITDNFRPVQRLNGRRVHVRKKPVASVSADTSVNAQDSNTDKNTADWDPTGTSSVNMASACFVIVLSAVSKYLFA
ncbi:carbonic anhydrase 7-like [Ruditapes philippinarum]|uniref:carbonic anhydrase 7-like n=1 Tax=Ruditapes philippinarum TaxID=129788 RepID=UPI00295AC704|nr:carbonic anhydrase 7-like [Ruditapes philippinarum]